MSGSGSLDSRRWRTGFNFPNSWRNFKRNSPLAGIQLVTRAAKHENANEVFMLSRGKLVQDWNRRLAAAESEAAQHHRLAWLYQMRARLYRFLLACYRQGDWRADEASTSADETQVV